jgi:hypothetical protein
MNAEVSKRGELDYVVNCGGHSARFGDYSHALVDAFHASRAASGLTASVSSDGERIARVSAGSAE